ncbi:MAG: hypothetical protein ACREOD_06535 [Candidatus Dormibacteria bacterium]
MGAVTEACAGWQGQLALAAVERLPDPEHGLLTEHLLRCEGCRQELGRLRQTAGALALVEPGRVAARFGEAGPGALPRSTARRWWARPRLLAPAAALLAGLAAVALILIMAPGRGGQAITLSGSPGVAARAQLTLEPWGTDVVLDVDGQRPGEVFAVSMQSSYGQVWQVGSYRATAGTVVVHLSCALATGQITRLKVSDPRGRVVLAARVS